jgi:hypothetical protein
MAIGNPQEDRGVDEVVPCPACGKWVQKVAVECRHCGAKFGPRFPINPDPTPKPAGPVSTPAARAAAIDPEPPKPRSTGETVRHNWAWRIFLLTFLFCLVLAVLVATVYPPHPLAILGLWVFGPINTIALSWIVIRSAVKDAIVSAHLEERGE